MAPASVQVVCMEPVVFLRGQSAVGEDARGRRRQIDFDAPPSQLRGLVTLNLPRPSRIKEISITLQGKARTDWPEGIGPNRLDTVEESIIFKQKVTLYNARESGPAETRPRASSVGPGCEWSNDDVAWPSHVNGIGTEIRPSVEASGSSHSRNEQTPLASPNDIGSLSSPSSYLNLAQEGRRSPKLPRSISKTAAKASAAILHSALTKEATHRQQQNATNISPSQESERQMDWRELSKGSHNYPFSIPLPSNLPPTLHADFGSNSYTIKAYVHRVGPLTSNLSAESEVTLVHAPDEDGQDEVESIVVERNWDDALRYIIVVMGKAFPVGGKIPIWAKFVPMEKIRIHRIFATLEERTAYYAKGRRVARHEVPRRWTLAKLLPPNASSSKPTNTTGILPILSEDPNAILDSPLAAMAQAAAASYSDTVSGRTGADDAVAASLASLADPTGPWELAMDLDLPSSGSTRINISSNHVKSNIAVHHVVKLSIRVERLDAYGNKDISKVSAKERKLFDILIEAPVSINHSHTANAWLTLPNYWSVAGANDANIALNDPMRNDVDQTDNGHRPVLKRNARTNMPCDESQQSSQQRIGSSSVTDSAKQTGIRTASQLSSEASLMDSSARNKHLARIGRQWLSLTGASSSFSKFGSADSNRRGAQSYAASTTIVTYTPSTNYADNEFAAANGTADGLENDLPTYAMIDSATGAVDPPPNQREQK